VLVKVIDSVWEYLTLSRAILYVSDQTFQTSHSCRVPSWNLCRFSRFQKHL